MTGCYVGRALRFAHSMPGYYAYFIADDGRISKRVALVSDDDEEAKRFAKQMVDGHAIELWQEARMIATFEPEK